MDNLRRFIVVTTIFLFLSASIAGFVLSLSYSNLTKGYEVDLGVDADPYNPDNVNDETLRFKGNILFIVGEETRPETDMIFILNYDCSGHIFSILYVPKDLKVTDNDQQETISIGSYFSRYSAKETASLISSVLDIGISYYIHLNDTNFIRFINMFGTVNFNMPVSIEYQDQYYDIDIKKGETVFDGRRTLALNQYYRTVDDYYSKELLEYYNGKDINRIKMVDKFVNAFISQKINENFEGNYYDLLSLLLPNCDTNISDKQLKIITSKLDKVNHSHTRTYLITGKESPDVRPYIVYENLFLDLTTGLNVSSAEILTNRFSS